MWTRIAIASLLLAARAWACTTFVIPVAGVPAIGKCYDWHMEQGMVLANPRGLGKRALPMLPGDKPAAWVARYASLTFNQYGRELPNGGMNEAGLVVEVMWLASSVFPSVDERPTVNELQWIQYQLDRFATVAEVVAHAPELRVSMVNGRVHYLVCDRGGGCAALEFLDGKLVVSDGAKVLTNNSVAESSAFLARHVGFGGKDPIPQGSGSLERFARASSLQREPRGDLPSAAFRVLDSVDNRDSRWHIVYDPAHLVAFFRTHDEKSIKRIDFNRFAHDCRSTVKMLDMATTATGDVTARFADYAEEANRKLVAQSLATIQLPPGTVEKVAHYPSQLPCAAP